MAYFDGGGGGIRRTVVRKGWKREKTLKIDVVRRLTVDLIRGRYFSTTDPSLLSDQANWPSMAATQEVYGKVKALFDDKPRNRTYPQLIFVREWAPRGSDPPKINPPLAADGAQKLFNDMGEEIPEILILPG